MQNNNQPAPANPQPESLEDSLEPQAPAAQKSAASPPPKPPAGKRFSLFGNLYLLVFVLLVFAAAGVVYVAMKSSKPSSNQTKTTSLTDQQISSLKGNTTLVGDSKQTLDIQSNSIFEGQVLDRGDLNVAGSLKVGGPLSLPSVSVGGNGTFGQIGISGGLNVAGDSTLQGALTVQKNLTVSGSGSFGSLNVSALSITTLQLRGDININQHILTSGTQPGRSFGTALGGGGTASVSGTDTAGTISINTGGSPPAGCFITVNFAKNFGSTPHVVISPSNSNAASLQYYANRSTSSFSICSAGVPGGGTNYVFDYIVLD
jgi:cytoskeletal protein CcmA (bactofilin family)